MTVCRLINLRMVSWNRAKVQLVVNDTCMLFVISLVQQDSLIVARFLVGHDFYCTRHIGAVDQALDTS